MAVSASAIETDVFTALRTLIIANKPSYTRVVSGVETTFTYTMVAEYPRDNPTFPIVVLNESKVNVSLLALDGSGTDYQIEATLDFYAKEQHGKKAISVGRDGLRATFINNLTNFKEIDKLYPMEDFWDDSNISPFQEGNQLINTGSSLIKFKF